LKINTQTLLIGGAILVGAFILFRSGGFNVFAGASPGGTNGVGGGIPGKTPSAGAPSTGGGWSDGDTQSAIHEGAGLLNNLLDNIWGGSSNNSNTATSNV
jgi:hypothetical protein